MASDHIGENDHTIEFVFRFETNMNQDELDELMGFGLAMDGDRAGTYIHYIPEGSHWRCVDIDPAAADLPGGNRLSVDDSYYELKITQGSVLVPLRVGYVYHVVGNKRTEIGTTGFIGGIEAIRARAKTIAKRHREGDLIERIDLD